MKITVKKQGEWGTTELEGSAALDLIRSTLRKIGDHCILSTDDGFPEELVIRAKGAVKKRAVQSLKGGNFIWDTMDEHGQPAEGSTIIQVKRDVTIVGIIHADGTYEKVGDGPDTNPFEEKKEEAGS